MDRPRTARPGDRAVRPADRAFLFSTRAGVSCAWHEDCSAGQGQERQSNNNQNRLDMTAPQTSCATNDLSTLPHEDISAETAVDSPLPVRSFGSTDCGRVRDRNEDHFLIAVLMKAMQVVQASQPQPKIRRSSDTGYLFVVAD